ncbi:MAG: alanine--glyoxylate aminotransferase family protein [bacterium]
MKMKERIRAPGPTPVPEQSRLTLAEENPYHRTPEVSNLIRECVEVLQGVLQIDWPVVPIAASGTGAMQMAVSNLVGSDEEALVIESGKFGERWTRLLEKRGTEVIRYRVDWGECADPAELSSQLSSHPDVTAVFGTFVETSTLVRHPVQELGAVIGDDTLFVVDAVSGLGAEEFLPEDWDVDAFVAGSQKGLMTPPGLSFLSASERALKRARSRETTTVYFDLLEAVDTLREDFQTPWTPSLNLIRSLRESLACIEEEGIESVFERHRLLGEICRHAVREAGLQVFSSTPSNVGTAVKVPGELDAEQLRRCIHEEYGTFFPGGQKDLKGSLVRIGHLGHVDYVDLLGALGTFELGLIDQGYDIEPGEMVAAAQRKFRSG